MFFRRKKKSFEPPEISEDGSLFVVEGQEYDRTQYETDSEQEDDDDDNDNDDDESDSDSDRSSSENGELEENAPDDAVGDSNDEIMNLLVHDSDDVNYNENESPETTPETKNPQKVILEPDAGANDHNSENTSKSLSSDKKKSIPTPPSEQNYQIITTSQNENNNEITSLTEKRSILALAAEHDRVDIIKSILQPSSSNNNNKNKEYDDYPAFLQLMLNNQLPIFNNHIYTENDIESVFIPPLHLAIASSSTNAASCLLRMGANPSIRPIIPKDWNGPEWYADYDDNGGSGSSSVSNHSYDGSSSKKGNKKWLKFHGLTAWELAFGVSKYNPSDNNNDNDSALATAKNNTNTKHASSGWFSWKQQASENDNDSNSPPFTITPSKLEGIKNAFTAEALRAIGSDEVDRLQELVESGLDSPIGNTRKTLKIGGKDLLNWTVELNAIQCSDLLQRRYGLVIASSSSQENESPHQDDDRNARTVSETTRSVHESENNNDSEIIDSITDNDSQTLHALKIKTEESEALASALTTMLDNLADEVSITQGLVFQNDKSSSNSALLYQIRTMKELRGQKDDEISTWRTNLNQANAELDLVMLWWKQKGGKEEEIDRLCVNVVPTVDNLDRNEDLSCQHLPTVADMKNRLLSSEANVRKLRTSIANLSEENSKNLSMVENLGLTGAVNLARSIKEEVRQKEFELQIIKEEESLARVKINIIRAQLENKFNQVSHDNKRQEEKNDDRAHEEVEHLNADADKNDIEVPNELNTIDTESQGEYDEEEFVEELPGDYTISYEEEEEFNDECSEISINTAPSVRVANGHSTDIVVRNEVPYFSLDVWNLLLRIVGLGKVERRKSMTSKGHNDTSISRVMIV